MVVTHWIHSERKSCARYESMQRQKGASYGFKIIREEQQPGCCERKAIGGPRLWGGE